MNYLPFCGYWFYGATSDAERASYFCSWGLLDVAPSPSQVAGNVMMNIFTSIFQAVRKKVIPDSWR